MVADQNQRLCWRAGDKCSPAICGLSPAALLFSRLACEIIAVMGE
jgi:hypothetical protein